MNAAQILRIAHTAGVTVRLDGEALVLEADDEPPQAVLEALTRFKPAIVALLTPRDSNWTTDDWWRYFNRRVAAARPRLSQMHAESFAFDCCLIEWLNQHLAPSAPGQCTWCGRPETSQGIVLPFGTEPGTHIWLHGECWPAWYRIRKKDAVAALNAMGLAIGNSLTNGQ